MSKDYEHQLSKWVLSVAGGGCAKVSVTASCHIVSDHGGVEEWYVEDKVL